MKREEIIRKFSEIPDGINIVHGHWHILISPPLTLWKISFFDYPENYCREFIVIDLRMRL